MTACPANTISFVLESFLRISMLPNLNFDLISPHTSEACRSAYTAIVRWYRNLQTENSILGNLLEGMKSHPQVGVDDGWCSLGFDVKVFSLSEGGQTSDSLENNAWSKTRKSIPLPLSEPEEQSANNIKIMGIYTYWWKCVFVCVCVCVLPREQRVCGHCMTEKVETEVNFLLHCNKYSLRHYLHTFNKHIQHFKTLQTCHYSGWRYLHLLIECVCENKLDSQAL